MTYNYKEQIDGLMQTLIKLSTGDSRDALFTLNQAMTLNKEGVSHSMQYRILSELPDLGEIEHTAIRVASRVEYLLHCHYALREAEKEVSRKFLGDLEYFLFACFEYYDLNEMENYEHEIKMYRIAISYALTAYVIENGQLPNKDWLIKLGVSERYAGLLPHYLCIVYDQEGDFDVQKYVDYNCKKAEGFYKHVYTK